MKNQTEKQIAEDFGYFASITRLSVSDRGTWKIKHHFWSPYDQNYLEYVREHVEGILKIWQNAESPMPEVHRIEECQNLFEKLYGLHVYMAWGTWAEGYFDNWSKRVKEYNCSLYADSIAHEFGEGEDDPDISAKIDFDVANICYHEDDELPF